MTVHDDCKGCYTYMMRISYDHEDPECDLLVFSSCPCRICIVKPMCNNECEKYSNAMRGVHDEDDW